MQKTSIAVSQFIETRENPTKMLDLVDEAFDQMTFSIQPRDHTPASVSRVDAAE